MVRTRLRRTSRTRLMPGARLCPSMPYPTIASMILFPGFLRCSSHMDDQFWMATNLPVRKVHQVPVFWLDDCMSSEYLVPGRDIARAWMNRYFNTEEDLTHEMNEPLNFEELLRDIQAEGILTPIRLTRHSDWELSITDGSHRLLCAQILGITGVPIWIATSDREMMRV